MKNIIQATNKFKFEIILAIFILIYIIGFSFLSIRKLVTLQSNYFDLGIMHQVVYNTSKGRFLEMTNQDFGKNVSRLAVHFDPILAVFAPIYNIYNLYDSPEVLLIAQTVVLGLGAWAVFLIAKNILKDKKISLLFSLSYLLLYPVERANVFDFHPVVLATTFMLFMIYFSLIKKYWPALIFIFLSFLTKEHVGLITLLFGLYLFFIKKERKFSLLIIFLSIFAFITTVGVIIPYFRKTSHFALSYFGDFGDSPKNVLLGIFTNPVLTITTIFKPENLGYFFKLIFSHGVFIIFAPIEFLIGLPELMINILSTNGNMKMIYFHYNSLIVPFILFSAILGYKKITQNKVLKKYSNIFLAVFVVSNLISIYYFNPLPFKFLKEPYWWGKVETRKINVLRQWHKTLDDNQKVATTPRIAPFFTGRQYYYNFLYDTGYAGMNKSDSDIIKKISYYNQAQYVVIDRSEIFDPQAGELPKKFYQDLISNTNYKMIFKDRCGIEVYKK